MVGQVAHGDDTGRGYPALTRGATAVSGVVVQFDEDRSAAALQTLDEIEGTGSGLYERVQVVTADGETCWTYFWCGEVEGLVELPGRWP